MSVAGAVEPAGARNTPLLAASGFGRTSVTAALLDAGVGVDDTGGRRAVGCKQSSAVEVVRAELATMAMQGRTLRLSAWGGGKGEREGERGGTTPLIRAAEFGHLATVMQLLERGGDPSAERSAGSGGGTALHAAAERGHVEVVGVLVSAVAAAATAGVLMRVLGVRDANGRTALEAAARWGHAGVVRALLRAHAAAAVASAASSSLGGTRQGHSKSKHCPPRSPPAVSAEYAACLAVLAVRWGHVGALQAVVECAGHGEEAALGLEVLAEAKRWSRGKIIDLVEEWRGLGREQARDVDEDRDERQAQGPVVGQTVAPPPDTATDVTPSAHSAPTAPTASATSATTATPTPIPAPAVASVTAAKPPSIVGAQLVHWDPATSAAVLYAPNFWKPLDGLAALRTEVDHQQGGNTSGYLPRDDPLVRAFLLF